MLLAVVSLVPAVGCRQVADIEEPEPRTSESALQCGGLASDGGSCAACQIASCCEASSNCRDVASCAPFGACTAACAPADVACLDTCTATALTASSPASEELTTCVRQHCDGQCVACGSVPLALRTGHGPLIPRDDASCRSCASESCCGVSSACAADADCLAMVACERGCYPDTTCHAECGLAHPGGTALYTQLEACLQQSCGASCPAPTPRWECVGKFQWPAARHSPVTLGGQVVDQLNLTTPVPGTTVTAFATQDFTLTTPLGTATTDATGFMQITGLPTTSTILSTATSGFNGFLRLEATGRKTTYFYVNKPIYDDITDYLMPMLTIEIAEALAGLSQVKLNPERGLALAFATDCQVLPSSGVEYELQPASPDPDKSMQRFYVNNYTTNTTLTETDPLGVGGFINVPTGPFTVIAREHATGKEVARIQAFSRPNEVSWLHLNPSSSQ